MAGDKPKPNPDDGDHETGGQQLYHEVKRIISRLGKESELTIYEAVGALEAVKADLLDELDASGRKRGNPET